MRSAFSLALLSILGCFVAKPSCTASLVIRSDDPFVGVVSTVASFAYCAFETVPSCIKSALSRFDESIVGCLPETSLCRSRADGTFVSKELEDTPVLLSMMWVSMSTLLSAEESAFVASAV